MHPAGLGLDWALQINTSAAISVLVSLTLKPNLRGFKGI